MKPALWFRIGSVLMLLFAAGHTYGFLTFRPDTPEGREVWAAMNNVLFHQGSSTFSYGGFYTGFGLFVSASFLFIAILAWWLGSMARRVPSDARFIAFCLVALQVINFALSLKFFALPPAILSALTAICFLVGGVSVRSAQLDS